MSIAISLILSLAFITQAAEKDFVVDQLIKQDTSTQFSTIQAAVTAANNFITQNNTNIVKINIDKGTYSPKNTIKVGNNIMLTGTIDPLTNKPETIISGSNNNERIFDLTGLCYVEDLTLENGSSDDAITGGGAAYMESNSDGQPTLMDCTITDCKSDNDGGGVFCKSGKIINCTISKCKSGNDGGGAYCTGKSIITGGTFYDNNTPIDDGNEGGGIYLGTNGMAYGGTSADPLIVRDNLSETGGGVFCKGTITGGVFSHNKTTKNNGQGGGIFLAGGTLNGFPSHPVLISYNSAEYGAGVYDAGGSIIGTYNSGMTPFVKTSLIWIIANHALHNNPTGGGGYGGGIYYSGEATITGALIMYNRAYKDGAGTATHNAYDNGVINCIMGYNIIDSTPHSESGNVEYFHTKPVVSNISKLLKSNIEKYLKEYIG